MCMAGVTSTPAMSVYLKKRAHVGSGAHFFDQVGKAGDWGKIAASKRKLRPENV